MMQQLEQVAEEQQSIPSSKFKLELLTRDIECKVVLDLLSSQDIHQSEHIQTKIIELQGNINQFNPNSIPTIQFPALFESLEKYAIQLWNASIEYSQFDSHLSINVKYLAVLLFALTCERSLRVFEKWALTSLQTCHAFLLELKDGNSSKHLLDTVQSKMQESIHSSNLSPYIHALLLATLTEWNWIQKQDPSCFISMRKALDPENISKLQGEEILTLIQICQGLAKHSSQYTDAIEWQKLVIHALGQVSSSKMDDLIRHPLRFQVLTNMALCYFKAQQYSSCKDLLDLVLDEDPSNLTCYHLKLSLECQKKNVDLIKDCFKMAIQKTVHFKSVSTIKIFSAMIHLISNTVSSDLAMECIDMLRPSQNPDKNMKFDPFLLIKLHLLTLKNPSQEPELESCLLKELQVASGNIIQDASTMESSQQILWEAGDKWAQERKWKEALVWYNACLKVSLQNDSLSLILHRKIGLCLYELKDYESALNHLEHAKELQDPSSDRSSLGLTFILYFMIYLDKQEMDKVHDILHALAIAGEILLLTFAVERAHAKGLKSLVKVILKEMLDAKIDLTSLENKKAFLVILRCLVRMNEGQLARELELKQSMGSSESDQVMVVETDKALVGQETTKFISRAYQIIKSCVGCLDEIIDKENQWFLKSCWNMAIHLESFTLLSAWFYEKVVDFAQLARHDDLTEIGSEMIQILIIACISSLQKRIQLILDTSDDKEKQPHLELCLKYLQITKNLETKFNEQVSFLEFQIQILQQDWQPLVASMESQEFLIQFSASVLKRMADFLILKSNPSSGILFIVIKNILNCIMKQDDSMDIVVFSQWLRILVSCSCVSNSKASLEVVDQALQLIHTYPPDSQEDAYPKNEVHWLLIKSWNVYCQFHAIHDMESANEWSKRALQLCAVLPASPKSSEIKTKLSTLE